MRKTRGFLSPVLGLLLAACSSNATPAVSQPGASSAVPASKELTKVVSAYGGDNMGDLQVWAAADLHLFEKHGLAVDVQRVSSASAATAALISNQTNFSLGAADAIGAKANGADVAVVAVMIPVYSYVLEVPASITTVSDLKGKKFGVDSYGSSAEVALRLALSLAGIDPDKDVSILAVGDVPTREAALISGAIQGTLLNPPFTLDIEPKGFHPLIDLTKLKDGANANGSTVIQRPYAAAHRDVVQAYVDAIVEANTRIRKDKASTTPIIKKYLKIEDPEGVSATYDFYVNSVYPSVPEPKPEMFKDSIDQLAGKNPALKGFDAASIIDASFVQDAVKRGLAG